MIFIVFLMFSMITANLVFLKHFIIDYAVLFICSILFCF